MPDENMDQTQKQRRQRRTIPIDEKISILEEKIEKRKTEIKNMKKKLSALKKRQMEDQNKELLNYIKENDLSPKDILDSIK